MKVSNIIDILKTYPDKLICAVVDNGMTHFVTNASVLSFIYDLQETNKKIKDDTITKLEDRALELVGDVFRANTKGNVSLIDVKNAIKQAAEEISEEDNERE